MFWAVAAAMAAVVAVAIVAPFLRASRAAAPAAAYDLRVYRAQLAEVERDLARGVIDAADAARLRTEIGRKVLDADRALGRTGAGSGAGRGRGLPAAGMAAAVVLLAVAAFALYLRIGRTDMPDAPIATRIAAAQTAYDARPTQAEAEAAARPAPPAEVPDPEYLRLVEQLREAVSRRPDDPRGLALLAEHEARLGRPREAAAAQRRLVAVLGPQATAADHARLAGMMTGAAGGLITPEAEAEVARALQLDPAEPQARYLAGLLQIQNQRPDRAFPIWRDLIESDPAAPWAAPIRGVIGELAWFAGQPDYQPPGPMAGAMPGPDAAAVAAAGEMSDGDRQQMIRGMVEGLEARLAQQGGTPEEWARLIGALGVLGERDHAAEILAEARQRFAASADALAAVNAAAAQAGLP